jgi:hypothetical protein
VGTLNASTRYRGKMVTRNAKRAIGSRSVSLRLRFRRPARRSLQHHRRITLTVRVMFRAPNGQQHRIDAKVKLARGGR